MTAERKKRKIEELAARRELYLHKERDILASYQEYGIGSQNVKRYGADLDEIRKAIDELDDEIEALEGSRPRFAGAIIPRDW